MQSAFLDGVLDEIGVLSKKVAVMVQFSPLRPFNAFVERPIPFADCSAKAEPGLAVSLVLDFFRWPRCLPILSPSLAVFCVQRPAQSILLL